MSKFYLCKLPQGLQVSHRGETIVLRGANVSYDADAPIIGLNKLEGDVYGFGLTELNDKQAEAFADWASRVTNRHESPEGPAVTDAKNKPIKLAEPFAPLENGAIMGPFNTEADAREEAKTFGSSVRTGFEVIDPKTDQGMKEAGIVEDDTAAKGKK